MCPFFAFICPQYLIWADVSAISEHKSFIISVCVLFFGICLSNFTSQMARTNFYYIVELQERWHFFQRLVEEQQGGRECTTKAGGPLLPTTRLMVTYGRISQKHLGV